MVNLSRHPLLKQCYDVMQAIEECGASDKLTAAVTKAGELLNAIDAEVNPALAAAEFIREDRYVVIKRTDLALLGRARTDQMEIIMQDIAAVRRGAGKRTDKHYVVISDDWPEYEIVWAMIQSRVQAGG